MGCCLCLTLIFIKWYLRLDLAVYDIEKYQSASTRIATLLKADPLGNLPYILQPYAAYTIPLGLLNFIFGDSQLPGQLLNTIMGLGVILNLHRLATLWFNRRVANYTALFMALYPYGWILSTTLNRDMMISFCITRFFCSLSELQSKERWGITPFTVGLGPGQLRLHGTSAPAASDSMWPGSVYLLDYQFRIGPAPRTAVPYR